MNLEKNGSSVRNQFEMEFFVVTLLYISTLVCPGKIKLIGNYHKVFRVFLHLSESFARIVNGFSQRAFSHVFDRFNDTPPSSSLPSSS